ncbi:hypothetical protein M0657_008809 [Pyricularia oryzae]|nr:hypothetical protein M9X92_009277 [Pyricularia oryzae]KAI7915997.1 hypothetical protein M0657_008809 [Pyricularia oryzae]
MRSRTDFSLRLYWRLLVPFASAVLLFLDDLGGLEHVEDILTTWTYLSMKIRVPFPPRVLVLCKETDSIFKPEALEARIHLKLRKKLRNHSQGNTNNFNYNYYYASRRNNPVPTTLRSHISDFLSRTQALIDEEPTIYIDRALIIASALQINAYPPGMHFFPPGQTFNELYDGCIDEKSTFGTLNARVRSSFSRTYHPPALTSIFFNVSRLFGQHLKAASPALFALPRRRTEASVAAIGYATPASS